MDRLYILVLIKIYLVFYKVLTKKVELKMMLLLMLKNIYDRKIEALNKEGLFIKFEDLLEFYNDD